MWSTRQGAHGNGGDCSPETSSASGGSVRDRGRRCGSSRSKTMMRLDAERCGECGSVNEEARGAQILPVGFAGDEADGGDGGRCRGRGCRVPAVEFGALVDAPESGEAASVLREAREGVAWPESTEEARRRGGGIERIGGSLGAEREWRQGEKKEEALALNSVHSRRGLRRGITAN